MSQEPGGRNIKTDMSQLRRIKKGNNQVITCPHWSVCVCMHLSNQYTVPLIQSAIENKDNVQHCTKKTQTFHNNKGFFPPAFEGLFFLNDSIVKMFFKAIEWALHILFAGFIHFAGGLTEGSLFHQAVWKSRNITAGEVQFLG